MTRFQTECLVVMALAVIGVIVNLVIVWSVPGALACIVLGYLAMILAMASER